MVYVSIVNQLNK